MIEGGVSFGQYNRIIGMNFAFGAGSQFASFALPGESACRYKSTEPSGLVTNLLRGSACNGSADWERRNSRLSYMVSDQKPLTGGIWPLSICMTYFLEAPSYSLPSASFCEVG